MTNARKSSRALKRAKLSHDPLLLGSKQHSFVRSYETAGAKFVPMELFGPNFNLDSTLYDNGDFTYVPCPEYPSPTPCPECGLLEVHCDQIFVSVSALCTPPGSETPKNTIGVFFASNSQFNLSECVEDTKICIARTQLHACRRALQAVFDLKMTVFPDLAGIVIKTDSDYIVRHMTECITKWRQNCFRNSKGAYVADADLFNQIDILTGHLGVQGVEVLFWRCGRLQNGEAHALAGAALRHPVQSNLQHTLGSHIVSTASDHVPPQDHSAPTLPAFPPGSFSSVPAYQL